MEKKLAAQNRIKMLDKVYALRKELHKNPEISGREFETKKRIKQFLIDNAPKGQVIDAAETGLLVLFGNKDERTVLIRGDIDALPIQEINEFEHKSLKQGVSHKCGHDGHTAILCNLAVELNAKPPKNGCVALVFQPAEEIGEGAKAILNDEKFKQLNPTSCYALHNLPKYEIGKVVFKEDAFTAAVVSAVFQINGKTAHAAEPEFGFNPAYFMSKVLLQTQALINNDIDSNEFALITPTHGMFGDDFAYGTSAGYGELRLTIRAWSNEKLDRVKSEIIEISNKIAKEENVQIAIEWTQEFRANMNHRDCVLNVVESALESEFEVQKRTTPFKWGEDFGLFTERFNGCMFGIGSGIDCPSLHNPDYDFPDSIIPTATKVFLGVINKELA